MEELHFVGFASINPACLCSLQSAAGLLPKSALFGFESFKTPNKPLFYSLKSLLTMAFQKLNCEGGSKT